MTDTTAIPDHHAVADSPDALADASSTTSSAYGSRMRLSILSIISVPILFALAPFELSMPFAVVALAAPLITTCDCRRLDNRNKTSAIDEARNTLPPPADDAQAEVDQHMTDHTAFGSGDTQTNLAHKQHQQHHHISSRHGAGQTAHTASGSGSGSSSSSSSSTKIKQLEGVDQRSSDVAIIRSEERMTIRKERYITSKLVVRKVVTSEIIYMPVTVRKERLEIETVYLDHPIPLPDPAIDNVYNEAAITKGRVRPLVSTPAAMVVGDVKEGGGGEYGKSYPGDRHNYVGLDECGREMVELVVCEERPRVVMDVVPVSRVCVTKVLSASSELVEMDLRKEHIEYVAPNSTDERVRKAW